jgi:hypothetical protein
MSDDKVSTTAWTPEELAEFDKLTWDVSSLNQLTRISGRLAMMKFVEKHGKDKCDAMWKVLQSDQ